MTTYWNHNTAYHRWLVDIAGRHRGRCLDVGCGDGLLVQRLAPVSASVTGIDNDALAVERARQRVTTCGNVAVAHADLAEFDAAASSFDVVVFVASLHHMDLATALAKARFLLAPGGDLLVVGLSANKSAGDWLLSGLALPVVSLLSRLHHETRDVGVIVTDPKESLREISAVAHSLLPGVRIRRGIYYRYLLKWSKP
ncbi:MAG: class I SAM-dependent methyltransferase [Mycobacterium sp.]